MPGDDLDLHSASEGDDDDDAQIDDDGLEHEGGDEMEEEEGEEADESDHEHMISTTFSRSTGQPIAKVQASNQEDSATGKFKHGSKLQDTRSPSTQL